MGYHSERNEVAEVARRSGPDTLCQEELRLDPHCRRPLQPTALLPLVLGATRRSANDALLAANAGRGVDCIDCSHVVDRVGSFRGHGTATCDSLYKHCELIIEGRSAGQRVLAQPAVDALYNGVSAMR